MAVGQSQLRAHTAHIGLPSKLDERHPKATDRSPEGFREEPRRTPRVAEADQRSMSDIVNDLIDQHEHQRFWDGVREAYERLRRDPAAWKDYQGEITL